MKKNPFKNEAPPANASENLKILFCYESNCSGETIATENIIRTLKKIKNARVYSSAHVPLTSFRFVPFFKWVTACILFWFYTISKNGFVDWVYTTTYTAGFSASILKPVFGYKVCFHYQGSRIPPKIGYSSFLKKSTQLLKRSSILIIHKFFLMFIDLIIFPSNQTQKNFVRDFPILKSKKIVQIPNGINLKVFKPFKLKRKLALRKKYKINANAIVIMYAGLLEKRKNVILLVKSFFYLSQKIKNVILILIFLKPKNYDERIYKQKLEKIIKKKKLNNNVLLIENSKYLEQFYGISDLFVLPSLQDHFPLVFLEALASKVIFLGTPVGAVKELLPKIDQRLLIIKNDPRKLAKQISYFLKLSNSQKKKITNKGYTLAKQLTWVKVSRSIFKSLSLISSVYQR
ncbi:hypothetical protein A2714_03125 [Candidatus Woesebacteria bacterium RIFCSPHIGHO2_01_FULL_38_9]|uniref:Glycosyl transferase family 1 domain-containing protein n=1 Tax=Candidatus Woesebacteria bacterium RIFCSPHIGHO2_01_FULL_38_9 TaxID=1802492 RepID=A0A1F7Y1I5_9BACT|nr:MAG: hypothetical protein A2714_03125 [Candidatus Woesebacteria bacterium RIFCSPHIGHO2_01_FULL_38_9]